MVASRTEAKKVPLIVLVASSFLGGGVSGAGVQAAGERELHRRVELLEARDRDTAERVAAIEANTAWLVRASGGVPIRADPGPVSGRQHARP
jgi:hypothetical protein